MAVNIRKPARARMWKRIGIIVASVSTLALATFVIISFLPHGNDAFSIRIDDPKKKSESGEENHFHMSRGYSVDDASKDVDAGTYIRGESLDKMSLSYAEQIEDYLAGLETKEGQQNFVMKDETTQTQKGYALVYTVYLVNDSKTDPQILKYGVNADSYYDSTDASILDYLRVLIQTQVVGEEEMSNAYYGQRHNNPKAPYPNALGNDREPISSYKRDFDADVITSTYATRYKGEDVGYCFNFNTLNETNKYLINDSTTEVVIPAGKVLRFTYVSYFEGEDMDSNVNIPSNSYILLSLHFGL